MTKKRVPLIILLLWLIELISSQLTHQNKIFLVHQEAYLFFPHRNFQTISTYTSKCSAKPVEMVKHHPSMTTLAKFKFNNTNLGISILGGDNTAVTTFHYAKINVHGICSIYQVDQYQINILYEYNFNGEFTHVIMLDKYHAFLWNCQTYARLEYSLFSRQVNVLRSNFSVEDSRKCEKYKQNAMICWGSTEINIITIDPYSFQNQAYQRNESDDLIKVLLPLDKEQEIFFICSFTMCNLTQLHHADHTIQILDNFYSPYTILGGDFNPQTSKVVIIHPATALIYTYSNRSNELLNQQQIDFFSFVECVFIENIRFLDEQILVNCNNFMGEAEHLVLIQDRELNKYFPFQPLENSDPDNPCLFDGNERYIFAVCKTEVITKFSNFEYFQLSLSAKDQTIKIECMDVDEDAIKIPQIFQLTILQAEYNYGYVNEPVTLTGTINYDETVSIRLKNKFAASAIDYYTIESPNCPFFEKVQYQNVDILVYVSLFNREKCIQIAAADNINFFRVLEINETLYYVELCSQLKLGFACQLVEIIEDVLNLKIYVFSYRLYKFYILDGNLFIQQDKNRWTIFSDVGYFEIRSQIIRVHSKNMYFSKSIGNIINNCGNWIEETTESRYSYSQNILEVDNQGRINLIQSSHSIRTLNSQLPQDIITSTPNLCILPYIFGKGYFIYVVNQTHISKLYDEEQLIVIYELPYNIDQFSIEEIRNVDNYIVIQYQLGFFEIYDVQRESIASLIAVEQEEILCDIILMDNDVILVPIRSQTYVLRIQTDPFISFKTINIVYSKFQERCSFQISPHLSNGSCPNPANQDNDTLSQIFSLNIRFNIQKIEMLNQVISITQPSKCNDCSFQISEEEFLGPVFAYEFNDDDYGAFSLISHLNIQDCDKQAEMQLLSMTEIHVSDQNTRSQFLMMNNTHVIVFDDSLNEIYRGALPTLSYCLSYTVIDSLYYLVICEKSFLLFNKTISTIDIPHNLTVNGSHSSGYQIKSQFIRDSLYYIYVLDDMVMHIFVLDLQHLIIEYVSFQKLNSHIFDFTVISNSIITLQNQQICISTNKIWKNACYNLRDVIPHHFAYDYDYQEFLTYHSTENCMRSLLISNTNENLHIDVEIKFNQTAFTFTILNAYAGYIGFSLKSIISINPSEGTYSNFILQYQDVKGSQSSSIIAYYQYNSKYEIDGYIGQIRSAVFLDSYFNQPYKFTFLSFPHRLYVTHLTLLDQSRIAKQYKKCVSVRVEDKLTVFANYNEPPLLKFLILKAKNINQLKPYYIKIVYEPHDQLLLYSLLGFGGMILFFVILVIATNRCKDGESELTIHFISEQIEKEFSEDNTNSDLLNSSSSPRSLTSPPLSEVHSNEEFQ